MYIKDEERRTFDIPGMYPIAKSEFVNFVNKYPNSVSVMPSRDNENDMNIYLNLSRLNKKDLFHIQDLWFKGYLVAIDSIKLFHITQSVAHFKINIEKLKADYSSLISKSSENVKTHLEYVILDDELKAFSTIILKSKILFDEIKEQTKALVKDTMEIFEKEILIPYVNDSNNNIKEFGIHIKKLDPDSLIFLIEIYYQGLSHIDKLRHSSNWEQIKQFSNNLINIRRNSLFYGDTFKECFMTDKYRIFNFSSTSISFRYTLEEETEPNEE